MRDSLLFYLNGRRCAVGGDLAFAPLADFLRDSRRLTGTKIGCGEGDCGACTVLVGRVEGEGDAARLRYRSMTSCVSAPYLVDASHVVTIEGLAEASGTDAVQGAMVDGHGSQCGFCTPGVVLAMTEVFESGGPVDEEALRAGLTGNLCRCTGYRAILDAGLSLASRPADYRTLRDRYPSRAMVVELSDASREPVRVESGSGAGRRVFVRPGTLDEAIALKGEIPGLTIVSGATELGVARNKRGVDAKRLMSLGGVPGLDTVTREGDVVSVGTNVTWSALEEAARREFPALLELTRQFASPQIRNVATLVGNIAYRSPVADSAAYLSVMGAELEVVGRSGTRRVGVGSFFAANDLAPDEIIRRVLIPLPARGESVRLYKISKRKEMDVSTFRAGFRVALDGSQIRHAALAFSGVGPSARRLPETEAFLAGKAFAEATFREAGRRARAEVEPTCRPGDGRDVRLTLAENVLIQYYFDESGEGRGESGVAV